MTTREPAYLGFNPGAHVFPTPVSDKVLKIVAITILALVWGFVRSDFLGEGNPAVPSQTIIPVWFRVLIMLLFAVLFLRMSLTLPDLFWMLGASVSLGCLPAVPLMPFVKEGVHLVLVVGAAVFGLRLSSISFAYRQPSFLQLVPLYLVICVISVAANYVLGGDLWLLKVGISELTLYFAYAVVCAVVLNYTKLVGSPLPYFIEGFVWATFAHAVVAAIGIVLIFITPFSAGGDTVFGLGYYDRLKNTFSSPDPSGVFFAASMPLVVYWAREGKSKIASMAAATYLFLVPWFVVATGSRTARLALIFAITVLLVWRSSRRWATAILPSMAVAFWVGFYYRSLPEAFEAKFLHSMSVFGPAVSGSNLGMKGAFFSDEIRMRQLFETFDWLLKFRVFQWLFGGGLGAAGNEASQFPSPHTTPLDVLMEVGIVGASALGIFVLVLWVNLWKLALKGRFYGCECAFALLAATAISSIAGLTNEIQAWGFVMVLYMMSITRVIVEKGRAHSVNLFPAK